MKKIVLMGIIALLLLSTMAAARQTVVTKASEMKIDLLRYDPAPVQPGDTTDIWFEIINLKDTAINDFDVTFVEEYPFKLVSDKSVHFNRLDTGEKIQFKFTVEVNKNALESNNNVFIQYYSRQAGITTSEPFVVSVKRLGSIVSTSVGISQAENNAAMIAPGAVANVEVSIQNSEDSVMKDVRVTLDLSSTTMPFATVGMTAEQKLKQINPGASASVAYKLVALPDAAAGVYKVPITISYYDAVGTLHETEDLVGIMVGAEPKLKVVLDSTELTKTTKNGNVVLKIINYGTTDVKFAMLTVMPGENYGLLSTDEHYIGNIDSDDYETVEFRLNANADSLTIPVHLEYMDANNAQYSESRNVEIMLYSPADLGLKQSKAWLYIVVLIVIGGAYFGYRKYKSKKQK
ncbi:MAG: hypothetical protein KJ955_07265 [Nanoarchaeota archaeon]|nr:hypothetical protein [Nanoarchaeota archaeon]